MSKFKALFLKINKNIPRIIFLILVITLANFLSIKSVKFANFYRKNVFNKIISPIFSFISNIFDFSLGEIYIVIFIVLVIAFAILVISLPIRTMKMKNIRQIYFVFFAYVLVFIYFIETIGAFMLYHTDKLDCEIDALYNNNRINNDEISNYIDENKAFYSTLFECNGDYSNLGAEQKLLVITNYFNEELNNISASIQRDEANKPICNTKTKDYIKCMHDISKDFKLLKGYYPRAKCIAFSNIMSQQYLSGIYFPFSMEANYNRLMADINLPATICHEYCHLKGYIREDEANFLSYLACTNSDNDFIKYSGLLSVYYYLNSDLIKNASDNSLAYYIPYNDQVESDDVFLDEASWEEIENNAIIPTDTVSKVSDNFFDSNLKANGVSSGLDNYSEVVRLLIKYYFGN